jgi:hypothetical protein
MSRPEQRQAHRLSMDEVLVSDRSDLPGAEKASQPDILDTFLNN